MENKKGVPIFILTVVFIGILAPIASAAMVHGSVYDIFLEELDKAVITIDTIPQQTSVSKNGEYSFELSPGKYTITATFYGLDATYESEEEIEINKEGNFKIDLILTPSLDPGILDEDINEFEDLDSGFSLEKESSNVGLIITIIAIILIILYFHFSKGHFIKEVDESEIKSENEEELEKVLKFIKELGGRVTQKDIRKRFPSSEAKVSLMITELESKGLVKKIKKGRGNVIILTKEGSKK
ncbi:hypothetical protein HOF78_03430 [Candidatus Woesearchaeota archaeon]|jgi:uncharacterized membrane protein|nr:hypothetical protein [Candidatus Woesearchaeota archaeon]MBT6044513.1 hypothetical protein [Candidatus Woesearchaeota archaeon]